MRTRGPGALRARSPAHLPRRRRHRPALLVPQPRRLRAVGGHRPVRARARVARLGAALPAGAPVPGGGRGPGRGGAPDPARRAGAALERAAAGPGLDRATCRPARAWARRAPTPCARSRRWTWRRAATRPPSSWPRPRATSSSGDLGRTVGKQDQYAAAHGGRERVHLRPATARVEVRRLALGDATREAFDQRFLLFGTGGEQRSAADMLATQVERTLAGDDELRRNLAGAEELARAACAALEADDPDRLGELMNDQWALKRERLAGVPMDRVELLRDGGAGGRRRRARCWWAPGGGGYLLVYAPPTRSRCAARWPAAGRARAGPFGLDEQRVRDGVGAAGRRPRRIGSADGPRPQARLQHRLLERRPARRRRRRRWPRPTSSATTRSGPRRRTARTC